MDHVLTTGVHHGLSYEAYDAIEAVRSTTLPAAAVSGLAYQHARDVGLADTPALKFGRFLHAMVLEPSKVEERYACEPNFGDCRKTENKRARDEWRAAHAEHEPVTLEDWHQAADMAAAIWKHPRASALLARSQRELTLVWNEEVNGITVPCKCRLDSWSSDGLLMADLKSTRHPVPHQFARAAASYYYDVSAAFYLRGVRACLKVDPPARLLAVQKAKPHDVVVYRFAQPSLERADAEVARLLARIGEWMMVDEYPGISSDEVELAIPDYVPRGEAEDDTITVGGEVYAL